jgi:IPT/TIG domain
MRLLRTLVTLTSVGAITGLMTLAVVAGTAGGASAATTAATSSCTFDGQAANTLITGVTPGGSITVACTGLPKSTSLVLAEASPLAGFSSVPSSDDIDEADTSDLVFITTTKTGTLPANSKFKTPTSFSATDPNAKCPPTAAQINAGLTGCAVAVATLSGTNYGDAILDYASQPAPATPSLALGSASAKAGAEVTVTNGTGPGDFWGNVFNDTTLTTSDITIGTTAAGSTDATVSAGSYKITTKGSKTTYGPLVVPAISGEFVVPCGITGTHTVTVTEPNQSLIAGTIAGTATLDVLPGTNPTVTGISPTRGPSGGGTAVTITGCNFTGATSVSFGTKAAASFTVNSDTSITAVSPPGSGTVNVVVTKSGVSSTTSVGTEFTYGFQGYDLVGSDGGTFNFGDAKNYGSLPGLKVTPAKPIVGAAVTADGGGYWLAGADGGIFAFGDAKDLGSLPGLKVTPNKPIVGIASPDTGGYWLVGADGGVFAFGDAKSYGSLPGLKVTPAAPIVGIAPTSDGGGYWLVGADGGVFAFGDAKSYGSLPGLSVKPAKPIVGIASPDSGGYWLVGADGGVFAFGDAKSYGSLPGLSVTPAKPVVGIASPDSGGYWLFGGDGGVFAFGDAKDLGSLPALKVTPVAPIVGDALA